MNREKGTWDMGVDYNKTYKAILSRMRKYLSKRAFTSYCYSMVLLIQLRNGSRVSEALDAALELARSKRREVKVRVRKRRDEATRLMVLPEEVKPRDVEVCLGVLMRPKVLTNIKYHCKRVYGINTHSLRYAYVTYLLKKGVSPSIVAKITGHAKLDYILRYTQVKTAEEALRSIR